MSLTSSPARRGNGTAVHTALVESNGSVIGTLCFMNPNYIHGRNHQAVRLLPEGTPVTCKTCNPDAANAAAPVLTETCPSHTNSPVWRDREIKAGMKRTWACGCSITV